MIDQENNLIIVQPDILLSGTAISNAIGCKRRAVLNERFKVRFIAVIMTMVMWRLQNFKMSSRAYSKFYYKHHSIILSILIMCTTLNS